MPSRRRKEDKRTTAKLLFGTTDRRTLESPEEREHMALVLGRSHDARVQRLVTDLVSPDPDNSRSSLARIAERHGLGFQEISDEYTRLKKAEGFIRAAHKSPEIMQQVADDSLHRWEDCGACGGMGRIDSKKGIVACSAKGCVDGKVYVRADSESIKLMFDTFGLTGKGGGVNVNLDLRKTDAHETLGDLAASLGPILEGNK
jgi:hypothetical protein